MRLIKVFVISVVLSYCQPILAEVNFYSDKVFSVNADFSDILYKGGVKETKLEKYFECLDKNSSYQSFSNEVKKVVKGYSLNGYFEALFFSRAVDMASSKTSDRQNQILVFKYLSDQGYDVQLTQTKRGLVLFVGSDEQVYQLQKTKIRGKLYYDLFDQLEDGSRYELLPFRGGVKKLSFKVKTIPEFKEPQFELKTLEYTWGGQNYSFEVNFNKTLLEFFEDVPQLDNQDYFGVDLSARVSEGVRNHLEKTILPSLESDSARVRFFLSFVRTLTDYKEDIEAYGVEKPMFAEEALYYQYSDCEDRAVLFSWLTEKYLEVPYVVLKFRDHVNIAVKLEGTYEKKITYEGQEFTLCETTNSNDILDVGQCPRFSSKNPPRMIYHYIPPMAQGE